MRKVWAPIAKLLESDGACALITVARADGSTPREAGARMVVRADGGYFGTIGGGMLEFQAISWAREALAEGTPGLTMRRFSLGPDLGQCCGGRVNLAVEVLVREQTEEARGFAALEASGQSFQTLATVASGAPVRRRLDDDSTVIPFALSEDGLLNEAFGKPKRVLALFGAGHVGRALVLSLAQQPFDVTWVDSRADAFPLAVPGNVTKTLTEDPVPVLKDIPTGAFVLVMTHSHALDEEIAATALGAQRFAYVGVIGSKTKRARFEKRLASRGLSKPLISNLVCPIGADGPKSKLPAAIAAGVIVELLIRHEQNQVSACAAGGLAQTLALGQ
ncbi:xanthine dehydrogenase accessory protein XdhC [Roseibium litorale]|uniref:Xanthine dehydrogenase accessory protein XdhC n=1 Tax=Roseibium litorale TaxID=2803841 RepID=A0ABR9CJU0_9HYPH|nr:xanthine dehydrogenase accessory protein XdhC [Roseibium litorale]MBD8890834.1 xanthine dehydrogenase accessory protein XdhC [Roseibium litorale]